MARKKLSDLKVTLSDLHDISMTEATFLFALRERATGRLMPFNRCGTRAEFEHGGLPRLFTTRQAAASALNCWRMGVWRLTGDEDGYWPEPSLRAGNKEIAARRSATEVDIVQMTLRETEPKLL